MKLPLDEFIRSAETIHEGASRHRVSRLLGDPILVTELADGGETWMYVRAEPLKGVLESMSVGFDASGRYRGLERKPVD